MARPRARSRSRAVVSASRAKAFASFTDELTSSLSSKWKNIRSGWGYENNKAASTNPSNYPLISAPIKNSDVTISLKNPGIGTGAALWVTDSGNWWAIVTEQQESVGTGDCSQNNPINNCGAGGNCRTVDNRGTAWVDYGNQCINTTSWTNANNCVGGNTQVCVGDYVCRASSSCCVGGYYTLNHQRWDNCKTGGNCVASGGNCKTSNWCGVPYPSTTKCCNAWNAYNACANLNACVGGYIWWSTQEWSNCATSGYDSCCDFGAWSNCAVYLSYNVWDACKTGSAGYPDSGPCSCCSRTQEDWRSVPTGYIDYCGATNACIATGGECIGHYNTYPRYIKIYKYVSNVLTEVASQTLDAVTSFSVLRGLKVTVSNSVKGGSTATITTKAYSDTNMTSQIGSDFIHQATGLKINTNYGIIAKPSSYNQNISVEQVSIG